MSEVGSHTNENQEEQPNNEDIANAILKEHFGIERNAQTDEAATNEPGNEAEESNQDAPENAETDPEPPATEEPKPVRKVKYNKKEVDVPEEQVDELIQKGLALDKERERKSEYEKALQRAAKLAGFDKVEDYLSNLDKIEEQALKKQQDQFDQLKQQLREDAEAAGLDPDKIEQYLENHPILQQAKAILEREQQNQTLQQQQAQQERLVDSWTKLFDKYPQLTETLSEDGTQAPWMTQELIDRINRGYDPIDAYEIVFRDEILTEERKKHEQNLLKQQRLNKRAKVEGTVPVEEDDDPLLQQVQGAFAAFGLDPSKAKQFMTKTRR